MGTKISRLFLGLLASRNPVGPGQSPEPAAHMCHLLESLSDSGCVTGSFFLWIKSSGLQTEPRKLAVLRRSFPKRQAPPVPSAPTGLFLYSTIQSLPWEDHREGRDSATQRAGRRGTAAGRTPEAPRGLFALGPGQGYSRKSSSFRLPAQVSETPRRVGHGHRHG